MSNSTLIHHIHMSFDFELDLIIVITRENHIFMKNCAILVLPLSLFPPNNCLKALTFEKMQIVFVFGSYCSHSIAPMQISRL